MTIPSEWAGPPVEWAGLPVSPTLPYLRVSKVCLINAAGGIDQTKKRRRWGWVEERVTGGDLVILPYVGNQMLTSI